MNPWIALWAMLATGCTTTPGSDCFDKRTITVERYHHAVVRQLILADSEVPADYTVNPLRNAEADMIEACESVDKRSELGTPNSIELDSCEGATALVEQRMQELVPGSH